MNRNDILCLRLCVSTNQARSYTLGQGDLQMDASPPQTSRLKFFLHINFPSPVTLDAQI